MVVQAGRSIFATVGPLMGNTHHWSPDDIALLSSANFMLMALIQPIIGEAIDYLGDIRVQATGALCMALGFYWMGSTYHFSSFLAASLLIGLGGSASIVAPLVAFVRLFPEKLSRLASTGLLAIGNLGIYVISLPHYENILSTHWQIIPECLSVFALLIGTLLCMQPNTPPRYKESLYPDLFTHIKKQPLFIALWPLLCIVYASTLALQFFWIGPWFHEVVGLPLGARLSLQAQMALITVLGTLIGAFMGAKLPKLEGWLFGVSLTIALLLGILTLMPQRCLLLWYLWAFLGPILFLGFPEVSELSPPHLRGKITGYYNACFLFMIGVLQYGLASISEHLPNSITLYTRMQWAQGALCILCLIATLFFFHFWQKASILVKPTEYQAKH